MRKRSWYLFALVLAALMSVMIPKSCVSGKNKSEQTYEIKKKRFTKEVRSKDGVIVLSCTLEYPQLRRTSGRKLPPNIKEVNQNIEKEALLRFRKKCKDAQEYTDEFLGQVYTPGMPYVFYPFTVNISYDITLLNDTLFSYYSTDLVWLGGAHPETTIYGESYDLVSGRKIQPEELLTVDAAGLKSLIIEQVQLLYEKNPQEFFSEEVMNLKKLSFQYEFYLTETGITVLFNRYQIAPYAAGEIRIDLPVQDYPEIYRDSSKFALKTID